VKISEIMSTLRSLGAAPRKSLGQNFLHDKNTASWIVEQLDLRTGEHVLEIGPGLGALTTPLLEAGVSATLIEKDKMLSEFLRNRYPSAHVRVEMADALEHDPREFFPERPVKLLGALPYYISTPLLFHYTAAPCPFSRVVLVLQKEVADRLTAVPGTKAYGSLSLMIQSRWETRRLRVLSRSVFLPAPQVDSAVVLLTPSSPAARAAVDWGLFQLLVRTGFSERRKQLGNLLARVVDPAGLREGLQRVGANWASRAEALSLEQWIRLTQLLSASSVEVDNPEEKLAVVNLADQVIGAGSRLEVHEHKLLHRAVHVFVLNSRGELLLQHRSVRKRQHPDLWDSSASGHVDQGEEYEMCARRELQEELGCNAADLRRIDKVEASEHTGYEFIWLYQTVADGPFAYHAGEIQEIGFFSVTVLDRWINRVPGDFAPGFLECYSRWRGLETP
jgi:16S rRNA (adenine1518-N6/adenine1519-N6)-dimethyltransferase